MKKLAKLLLAALILPAMLFAKGDVVAYLPTYRSIPTPEQFDKLTHLVLMAIVPGPGTAVNIPVNAGGWSNNIEDLVSKAHQKEVEVIIGLGGWGGTGSFPESVKPANRQAFVNNIMSVVNNYGFDGVDIDWEYPTSAEEVTNFEGFMIALKEALGEKRLSFAIGAMYSPSKYTMATYTAMDALHLMTYDMVGDWGRNHADETHAKAKLDEWLNSGMIAKDKVFLGVPFYGRPANGGEAEIYPVIIQSNPAQYSQVDEINGWCYDGIPTIKRKTAYAYEKEAGGIMIWEIGQDMPATSPYSLLKAIDDETMRLGGREEEKINVYVNHNGNGTVTVNGNALNNNESFEVTESGSNVTVNVEANNGYEIVAVFVDGTPISLTDGAFVIENVSASKTVMITFGKRITIPATFNSTEFSKSGGVTPADNENGKYIGDLGNGSFVEYLINVPETGNYKVSIMNAVGIATWGAGKMTIFTDNEELTTINPNINDSEEGWYDFKPSDAVVPLTAGNQTLRIEISEGPVNIENISITKDGGTTAINNRTQTVRVFGAAIFNGKINLSLPSVTKNATLKLFDVRGRVLFEQKLSINSNAASISLPKSITQNQAIVLQVKTDAGISLTKKVLIK